MVMESLEGVSAGAGGREPYAGVVRLGIPV